MGVNPHRTDGLQSIRCMSFIRALAVGVNPHRTNYALTDVMNPAVRKNVRILYKIMISQDFKVWLLHKRHKLPHSTRFQDFWASRERGIWKSQCYSPAVRHLWTDREQVIGRRYRRGMSAGCALGSSMRWWYDPHRQRTSWQNPCLRGNLSGAGGHPPWFARVRTHGRAPRCHSQSKVYAERVRGGAH